MVSLAVLVENPTDAMPAPEIWFDEFDPANTNEAMDVVAAVVLPTANPPTDVGPEMTMLELEMPTDTSPAPSYENEPCACTPEVVERAVLPTA